MDSRSGSLNLPALTAQSVITATYNRRHPDEPTRTDSPAQPSGLDQLLTPDEGARFAQFLENTTIRICVVCRLPKILECSLDRLRVSRSIHLVLPGFSLDQRRALVNEFTYRTTSCCNQRVCRTCCLQRLVHSIEHDWWSNLGGPWLSCPTSCRSQEQWQFTWQREHVGLMTNLLEHLKDSDCSRHVRFFERATLLRHILWNMGRRGFKFVAGEDILRPKNERHRRLIQDGLVTDFFDLDIGDNPSIILIPCRLVSPDGSTYQTHTIALAIHPALRRMLTCSQKGLAANKKCAICLEVSYRIFESTPEEDVQWGITMGGQSFLQTFISDGVQFPLRCWLPECAAKHSLHDVCCTCMREHVKSRIEPQHAGKIPCPLLCGHVFTYEQMRCFTDPDTFTGYDRMLLNDALEKEDGFRWCLRQGCQSGEIQCISQPSPDDDGNRTLIKCSTCGFDMCYECRTPFHAGISCETYRARKRIEEETAATEELLATMSKPCPSCGVAIQKNTGCQHMTCGMCTFEFCWECLADWRLIWSRDQQGRKSYHPTAHNEGCYFRNPNVPPGWAVLDRDVAEYRAFARGELGLDTEPLVTAAFETLEAAALPPRQ